MEADAPTPMLPGEQAQPKKVWQAKCCSKFLTGEVCLLPCEGSHAGVSLLHRARIQIFEAKLFPGAGSKFCIWLLMFHLPQGSCSSCGNTAKRKKPPKTPPIIHWGIWRGAWHDCGWGGGQNIKLHHLVHGFDRTAFPCERDSWLCFLIFKRSLQRKYEK